MPAPSPTKMPNGPKATSAPMDAMPVAASAVSAATDAPDNIASVAPLTVVEAVDAKLLNDDTASAAVLAIPDKVSVVGATKFET